MSSGKKPCPDHYAAYILRLLSVLPEMIQSHQGRSHLSELAKHWHVLPWDCTRFKLAWPLEELLFARIVPGSLLESSLFSLPLHSRSEIPTHVFSSFLSHLKITALYENQDVHFWNPVFLAILFSSSPTMSCVTSILYRLS